MSSVGGEHPDAPSGHWSEVADYVAWLVASDLSDAELDRAVEAALREAMARVDCVECHNCCQEHQPQATDEELVLMAQAMGVALDEFIRLYTIETPLANRLVARVGGTRPSEGVCCMLDHGSCIIYSGRPWGCRVYPYHLGSGVRDNVGELKEAYRICPAVRIALAELRKRLPRGV